MKAAFAWTFSASSASRSVDSNLLCVCIFFGGGGGRWYGRRRLEKKGSGAGGSRGRGSRKSIGHGLYKARIYQ